MLAKENKTKSEPSCFLGHEDYFLRADRLEWCQRMSNEVNPAGQYPQDAVIPGEGENALPPDSNSEGNGKCFPVVFRGGLYTRIVQLKKLFADILPSHEKADQESSGLFFEMLGGHWGGDLDAGKNPWVYLNLPSHFRSKLVDQSAAPNAGDPRYNWANKIILIAEDEESNFLYLKEVLRKTYVTVLWAKTGLEAVEIVKNNPSVSLILMDIKMPGMDGLEATRKIKQMNRKIPVIAQTAYAMEGDETKSRKAGCDDYIAKPIRQFVLLEKIAKYLDKD